MIGDTGSRKIESTQRMKEIMTSYYIEAKTASLKGKKVAWITSGGPVEPLIAMDVIPVYPENHGAMIGASKMGGDLCTKAEAMGYSPDLCSYALTDIACSPVNGVPIGGLPAPDFMVCCNNICGTVMKWYEIQARYYNVPLFIFDTPFIHSKMSSEAETYLANQVNEYIEFLETVTGEKSDPEKLHETGMLSIKGQKLWQEVLDTCTNRPSPMSAFDAFFHLALIVTLRGKQTAVDYYSRLLEEMKQRVSENQGAIEKEEYRLMWDNLPVWYNTRWLSEKLASHNACLVADTYTSAWSGVLPLVDENDFMKSMGIAYSSIYINISIDIMFGKLKQMIEKYSIDGLVMHSNRSCKPYSLGQYDLRKMVMDEIGIPVLIIESDHVDERAFSKSQIETRIDAFMEIIKQKKL